MCLYFSALIFIILIDSSIPAKEVNISAGFMEEEVGILHFEFTLPVVTVNLKIEF